MTRYFHFRRFNWFKGNLEQKKVQNNDNIMR